RARRVEQHDQAERPDLAAAPDNVDRRAAMRHAAMNGTPQIEPPSAAADLLAAHQPGAHDPGEPPGQRVRLCNVGRIDDMTEVGPGETVVTRRALAPAATVRVPLPAFAALDMSRLAERAPCRRRLGEAPLRRTRRERRGGADQRGRASHAVAEPMRVENLVEL